MKEAINNHKIPAHWQLKKLGEVSLKVERVKRKEKNPSEELLYLDIGGIDNFQNKIVSHKEYKWGEAPSRAQQIVFQDDILFSTVRTYLKNIAFVDTKKYNGQIASSGFCVIRVNNQISLPKYLFYYSISQTFLEQLNKLQTGSSYPAVRDKDVFSQLIPLPPLPEQQAIVAKIEELLSELENGKQQLLTAHQQLKVYRQSLLKWAFEGKLTNKNVKEGELPKGWKTEKLGLICEIKNGKNQKLVENPNGKYPIYGSAGKMGFADSYLCDAGSTIVGRKGTINKPLYVNEKFWNVDTAFGFMPNTDLIINRFLYFFCLGFNFAKLDKSTTIPSLAKTDLQKIDVVLPPLKEQELIVSELESKLTVCDKIEETISQSLQQAETLRQSILKKAFEGRLVTSNEFENVL
jgi:type I restriction enzyme, S subunit